MHIVRTIILVSFGGSLLLLAVRRLREYKLKERYALVFLLLGLPFLGLAIYPRGIEMLSSALQISQPTLMLLCVSIFLILTVFELLTIVSLQDRKITTLAQLVGVLMERHEGEKAAEQAPEAMVLPIVPRGPRLVKSPTELQQQADELLELTQPGFARGSSGAEAESEAIGRSLSDR